ncbi:hypothetical protein YC2023_094994 [Brassica napus]
MGLNGSNPATLPRTEPTFSVFGLYYSQISPLILLKYYDDAVCVLEVRETPAFLPGRESDSDPEDLEHAEKLRQIKAVLEEGEIFSGIYRKVQLKPLKWDGEGEEEKPVEALMILQYGGVLTHAGRKHVFTYSTI